MKRRSKSRGEPQRGALIGGDAVAAQVGGERVAIERTTGLALVLGAVGAQAAVEPGGVERLAGSQTQGQLEADIGEGSPPLGLDAGVRRIPGKPFAAHEIPGDRGNRTRDASV